MKHRLDPLLRPGSVAIVGASATPDSMGEWALKNLLRGGFQGRLYPVNPNYDELQGHRCYAALADLPETPDLVVFAVGDHRLEQSLDEAIACGVPAAVIQSTLYLDDDAEPPLRERVRARIEAAGMLVCGANGMGYYNVRDRVWTCGFDSADHAAPGNVSLLCHSGAAMSGLIDADERLRVNLAVSAGNELSVTMADYLDFALDLPETRVVGLFLETARDPAGFRAALDKAARRGIPVVALKVGRTEKSAELTVSHSGSLAGDDASYEALFDRYGVQRASDQDELATMLIMFAEMHPVGPGGLVTLHDSGGERSLLVDLAHAAEVPLTELSATTVAALQEVLEPELPAINPLDGWSRGGPGAGQRMTQCLTLLMQDPGAAIAGLLHDRGPDGKVYPSYIDYMRRAHEAVGKPVALVAAWQGTGCDQTVVATTQAGLPVLDGVRQFLRGVHALFAYRDFQARAAAAPPVADAGAAAKWRSILSAGSTLGEAESLALLADFDVPTTAPIVAQSFAEVAAAAAGIGYPVALKSARSGLLHKSEQGGVVLGIEDAAQLQASYADMQQRLGSDVLVAGMAPPGVEMILGVKRDPQFGPVVLLGFGGVLAETIADVQFALPPFDAAHARRCLDRMRLRPLLDGVRGNKPVDVDAFCDLAARFSAMAAALGDVLSEVDVNPVIVHAGGAVAVDALVVGFGQQRDEHAET